MTDELIKKADLYANNTRFTEYDNPSLSESLDISEEIKQAYIAGAKEYEQKFIDMNKTYQDLVNGWVIDYRDLEKENEELKRQVSYLEDNLRVARKDREDLRDSVANGLEEFIKEKPHTSLGLLANKAVKEENEQLKARIEQMIQDVSDMKYFTSFGTVTNACKELLRKWELVK